MADPTLATIVIAENGDYNSKCGQGFTDGVMGEDLMFYLLKLPELRVERSVTLRSIAVLCVCD